MSRARSEFDSATLCPAQTGHINCRAIVSVRSKTVSVEAVGAKRNSMANSKVETLIGPDVIIAQLREAFLSFNEYTTPAG